MTRDFHIIRYNELPNIPLMLDQVLMLANQTLEQFGDEAALTSSMVNNYVKRKLITPPSRKRYERDQTCMLIWICLLKQSLDLDAIQSFVTLVSSTCELEEAYNGFCCNVEALLGSEQTAAAPLDELVLAAAQAVASHVRLVGLIE